MPCGPHVHRGHLVASSPLISLMASAAAHEPLQTRPLARQVYRFLWNGRFSHRYLLRALYIIAHRTVARYQPAELLLAVDPVSLEKPYAHALEGVSIVSKSTLPTCMARDASPVATRPSPSPASTFPSRPSATRPGSPIRPRTLSARTTRSVVPCAPRAPSSPPSACASWETPG